MWWLLFCCYIWVLMDDVLLSLDCAELQWIILVWPCKSRGWVKPGRWVWNLCLLFGCINPFQGKKTMVSAPKIKNKKRRKEIKKWLYREWRRAGLKKGDALSKFVKYWKSGEDTSFASGVTFFREGKKGFKISEQSTKSFVCTGTISFQYKLGFFVIFCWINRILLPCQKKKRKNKLGSGLITCINHASLSSKPDSTLSQLCWSVGTASLFLF